MTLNIIEIIAKKNIGISQEGYPIDPTLPLWSSSDLSVPYMRPIIGSNYPAAFILNDENSIELMVVIQVSRDIDDAILEASYQRKVIFRSENVAAIKKDQDVKIDVYNVDTPRGFRRFSGELKWKIKWNNKTLCIKPSTYLELFWLYDYDYMLFRKGVPVEILRQVAFSLQAVGSEKKSKFHPSKLSIIKAIVKACFFRNPPAYDIYKMAPYFLTTISFKNPMAFRLLQYLNATHDLTTLCNCYDMAAAVQVFLKAIGIRDVNFCFKKHFGYLNLTRLVGRGFCNHPRDLRNLHNNFENDLVMNATNEKRKKFASHSFCCLPDETSTTSQKESKNEIICKRSNGTVYNCRNCRVLDACIGPHTGTDNITNYLNKSVDTISPKKSGEFNTIQIYNGITHIDWNPLIIKKPDLPHTEFFEKKIRSIREENSEEEYLVSFYWPDPRSYPALDKEWEIFFEQVIPGYNDVHKIWKLRKEGAIIEINLHVFSPYKVSPKETIPASEAAGNLFLAMGSSSSTEEPPYERGLSYLGNYSAKWESEDSGEYFWPSNSVIFRVITRNTAFNVDGLLLWLNELAVNHSVKIEHEDDIDQYLPSLEGINDLCIETTGGRAVVETICQDVFLDFVFNEKEADVPKVGKYTPGIQLISQEDNKLTFLGLYKSINDITVAVIDKNTFLTNSKKIIITVKNNESSKTKGNGRRLK